MNALPQEWDGTLLFLDHMAGFVSTGCTECISTRTGDPPWVCSPSVAISRILQNLCKKYTDVDPHVIQGSRMDEVYTPRIKEVDIVQETLRKRPKRFHHAANAICRFSP